MDATQSANDRPPLGPRFIIGAVIVVAVVVVVHRLQRRDPQQQEKVVMSESRTVPAGDRNDSRLPPPPQTPGEYLNTRPQVKYVGSATCNDCHPDQHESFAGTQHSHSLRLVDPQDHPPDGVVNHLLSKRSFEIKAPENATVMHRESFTDGDGEKTELAAWPVRYQIGSGHVAFSYLIEDDGFLLQSPVTWFAGRRQWDMSPGYDTADHASFGRVIRSGCLYCHTGHLDDPGKNGLRHRITELSISCERCHGPGELHVKRHTTQSSPPDELDRTIVNPGHLERDLSEAVCAQCHLNGDVQATVRGRSPHDFRPGLPLHEYRLEFRQQQSDAELRVAGHVEQLHKSECYQKSTTLTCITCHLPHENPAPLERLAHNRQTCINCHQQQTCGVPIADRNSRNDNNCVECHMPQSATEVTHVALTDHRIGIHREPVSSQPGRRSIVATDGSKQDKTVPTLIPLQSLEHLSEADRKRSLGLAHLALVRMSGKAPDQIPALMHAGASLRQAYEAGMHDPELLTALAGIARDFGEDATGIDLADRALLSPGLSAEKRLAAIDVLAELHFRNRRTQRSVDYLKQVTREHRSPLHWFLLGQVESLDANSRLEALRKAVSLAPGNPGYRHALAFLLRQQGLLEESEHHRRIQTLLSP